AGNEERDVGYVAPDRREQPLSAERREVSGVGHVDVAEIRLRDSCVCAHLETGPGRRKYDASWAVDVEEIRRQGVRRTQRIRDAIPVDFASQTAERTVRSGSGAAADRRTERIPGGRDPSDVCRRA